MREIKFRQYLWNDDSKTTRGRMIDWEELLQEAEESLASNFTSKFSNASELMQYTGLKDKNDVEIYEGDILQTDRYPGENYYIEIAVDEDPPHNFIYGWRKKPNATVRGISDGIYTILESERNFKDSEIIGNIYENPELLEVE